jgi:hypothetical protein
VVYPPQKKAFLMDFLFENMAMAVKKALVQERQKTEGLNYLYLAR